MVGADRVAPPILSHLPGSSASTESPAHGAPAANDRVRGVPVQPLSGSFPWPACPETRRLDNGQGR